MSAFSKFMKLFALAGGVRATRNAVTGRIVVIGPDGKTYSLGAPCYKDNGAHAITAAINTEEVLTTLTVPASDIRDDTVFEVYSQWDMTNSANAKYQKITLNGQALLDISQTTVTGIEPVRVVRCRGAGSQVASNKYTPATFGTTSSSGSLSLTADLSGGAVFQFVGKRTNLSDSLTLQSAMVRVS